MSSTSDNTTYNISMGSPGIPAVVLVQVEVAQSAQFGDAQALSLYQALLDAFPAGWGVAQQSTMLKIEQNQTVSSPDLAASPPVFQ